MVTGVWASITNVEGPASEANVVQIWNAADEFYANHYGGVVID